MALSSICFMGWWGVGMVAPAIPLMRGRSHWGDISTPGHYDGGIDDECAATLTPEQYDALSSLTPEQRELGRELIVREGNRPGFLRRLAGIPFGDGRWQ